MPYTKIVDIITHFPVFVFYIFFVNASFHTSVYILFSYFSFINLFWLQSYIKNSQCPLPKCRMFLHFFPFFEFFEKCMF